MGEDLNLENVEMAMDISCNMTSAGKLAGNVLTADKLNGTYAYHLFVPTLEKEVQDLTDKVKEYKGFKSDAEWVCGVNAPTYWSKLWRDANCKSYYFVVPTLEEEDITVKHRFENLEKEMFVDIYGYRDNVLGARNYIAKTIKVDTEKYDRYDWCCSNGLLQVNLYEKKNPVPDFKEI